MLFSRLSALFKDKKPNRRASVSSPGYKNLPRIPLTELPSGKKGEIIAMDGNKRLIRRMISLGVTIGCPIRVITNTKNAPILISVWETTIALNPTEADRIFIKPDSSC